MPGLVSRARLFVLVVMRAMDRRLILLSFGAVAAAIGCSPLTTGSAGKSLLQMARMSPDSVIVEVALLDLDGLPPTQISDLWLGADEQQIPIETRQALARHGLRCGVVGSQLPAWLTDQLASQRQRLQLDESAQTAVLSDVATERRIQCRANQRRSIPVASKCAALTVPPARKAAEDAGADAAPPDKYADAQCYVSLTPSPKGNGQVELELVPEIQHGPVHQRWVGQDGLFRLDAARDSVRYDRLRTAATLGPGQVLILLAQGGQGGWGDAMVGSISDASPSAGRLALFRVAQTQFDDLFSPLQAQTPVATQPP